ncbi:MAG: dihydrofolate reductase [Bacteroidaceae bacterium]|nr:dihydrofolate reductase [Bacteroidaceae bacterium]
MKSRHLYMIVAVCENHAIGRKNDLLYHLPADLKHFKQLTTGHTIVMGRHTFESLPKGALPNRRNIVLSRTATSANEFPEAECFPSLDTALETCAPEEVVFIIGGGTLYRTALPYTERLYLTSIHASPADADVFFPELDLTNDWVIGTREEHRADEKHPVAFTFVTLTRK